MKAPAKYRVGQMVYTYQSKLTPIRIVKCVDYDHVGDYPYSYQMILNDGKPSNWTNEESISETPIKG